MTLEAVFGVYRFLWQWGQNTIWQDAALSLGKTLRLAFS